MHINSNYRSFAPTTAARPQTPPQAYLPSSPSPFGQDSVELSYALKSPKVSTGTSCGYNEMWFDGTYPNQL